MINYQQFKEHIIEPVYNALRLEDPLWKILLTGTFARESRGGTYIVQIAGPALGPFQMEPVTYHSLWDHFLPNRLPLYLCLANLCHLKDGRPEARRMVYDLYYSCAMAAVRYLERRKPLPKVDEDFEGNKELEQLRLLANYWKKYYNTPLGKGTPDQFIRDYQLFTGVSYETKSKAKEIKTKVS